MNGEPGGFTAAGWHGPDIALEGKGYQGSIGVDGWLAQ
jgi:hypothetical protein